MDELRLEKAGRERAEELLVKQVRSNTYMLHRHPSGCCCADQKVYLESYQWTHGSDAQQVSPQSEYIKKLV